MIRNTETKSTYVMELNILFYIFREYQEEGKIPEHICYNV